MKHSGPKFEGLVSRAEQLMVTLGEFGGGDGPYRNESLRAYEGALHELAHILVLRKGLVRSENSIAQQLEGLSSVEKDAQEVEAVAIELYVAELLGYPLNRQRVLTFVSRNSLLAARAIPLQHRRVWLREAVREVHESSRSFTTLAKLLVSALSVKEAD